MSKLVISIDSSTTASKAIAWDRSGRAVAEGRASYPLLTPYPTWGEQNAEDWWTGATSAIRDCVSQIDVRQVEALAITHQRESFVVVDATGKPLRNGILWLDERSREQVSWMAQRFGGDHLHWVTGKPPSMTASISKIIWLMQYEPALMAQAHKILDVQAFLVHRLTGHFCTSLASADPMGLVDLVNQRWASEVIEGIGLRVDQFAELFAPGTPIGTLHHAGAAATGLPEGLPLIAGAGDGQCAGLGANATGGGRAYLNLGTAVVAGVMSESYPCDRAFRTLYAPVPGSYFAEHVLRGGVFTVGWYMDKFASDLRNPLIQGALSQGPEQILETAAAKVPPGAQGLMLVPYWNNVMNPYWDPAASGITIGWTGVHGREHFYRAILEGIAFEQRLVGDAMMAVTGSFSEYVTMGGGSKSDLWCQIMADVTGVPVVRSTTTEATCLGAAILAASAIGWYGDVRSAANGMTGVAERFTPNPATLAIYERLYQEVYKPLFPTLQPLLGRLAELAAR